MIESRLREVASDDAQAIARIYEHYVRTTCVTFEEIPPSSDEIRSRMQKTREIGLPYYVAETSDDLIIGYAYASPFHARSAYRFCVENSVYVETSNTRKGIGTALMERVIRDCSARGYRQMIAMISDKPTCPSALMHGRLGFRLAGSLSAVGMKFGRWVDVIEMQLALGEGMNSIPTIDPGRTSI